MNTKSMLFIGLFAIGFSTISQASQAAVHPDFIVNAHTTAAFNNLGGNSDGYIVARIPTQFGVSIAELPQFAAAIEKIQFARTAHALGIVGLAICLVWWGSKRLNNPATSKSWQDHLTNAFFIGSGIVLAVTAPLIAAYAQKLATSV